MDDEFACVWRFGLGSWDKGGVLVVEDEPDLLGELIELFDLRGYSVRGVNCAEDALDFMHLGREAIAIICDLNLPGRSGIEFLADIGINPELRASISCFILMTGHMDLEAGARAIVDRYGATVLTKPISARELLPLVESKLGAADTRCHGNANE
ncbi:hypothetical protein B5C34_08945 [Pacificimonas flava]|uniref:Response regulatory domain-containing protein n=2 Tax=Pacificimonas TaxID=1960290 RepID=A0A219B5C2_9SPHN|nr:MULTISPECIES: response regulator [Pacificimonas]MBZ6379206.1 response regulator [Pacificimonas aurantium]OWV33575.1 hypothetical protein B5C34_08945 [Pacificimonas flava]